MSETTNPYQAPESDELPEPWWVKIGNFFRRRDFSQVYLFLEGEIYFMVEGIAFFVDRNDLERLYAASTSESTTIQRMNLVVSETVRVLPIFLAKHPDLGQYLRGRRLAIRLVTSYESSRTDVLREQLIDWNLLDELLIESE